MNHSTKSQNNPIKTSQIDDASKCNVRVHIFFKNIAKCWIPLYYYKTS